MERAWTHFLKETICIHSTIEYCSESPLFCATFVVECSIPYTRQEISETTNELGYLETLNNRLLTNASWGIVTAFAFGLAITVLAYVSFRWKDDGVLEFEIWTGPGIFFLYNLLSSRDEGIINHGSLHVKKGRMAAVWHRFEFSFPHVIFFSPLK